tara:strand:- start:5904 stop:6644 length:741 start_codon:yes stop_codon:yes gene_type:complete
MYNYVVLIPTHKRNTAIRNKTLALLRKHNIPDNIIYIFPSVESNWQVEEGENYNIITDSDNSSVLSVRNHFISMFPEKQKIVEMDDDIEDLINMNNESVENLNDIINECFAISKGNLWGFNSTSNMYYSNGKVKVGLYSIINSFLGYENDKSISLSMNEKEDFERVILHYLKDKPVYKFTQYGIKTKYWTNKGGFQDHYDTEGRNKVQEKMADLIHNKYPDLTYISRRKNGKTDIKFKRQKRNKYL